VNDDIGVNLWQDRTVTKASTPAPAGQGTSETIRAVSDVETLKVLADPIRLGILSELMNNPTGTLPVMSVKELAAALGEPQTKLYRHVKQLEAAGLIRVAASRVVSGIVEQRYQACQSDLVFGPSLTDAEKVSAEAEAAIAAALDMYRGRYFAARRGGLITATATPELESHRRVIIAVHEAWVPAAKAAEIRERLQQIVEDLSGYAAGITGDDDQDPTIVPVNVLIGYFSPDQPER